jgi:hypothetical protein
MEFTIGGGKLCGTGRYNFGGGQIVWNWTAHVWGANCVEMDTIGLGDKFC